MTEEASDPEQLRVAEIFFSLQGESTHQGLPCIFVRLTGCNLRCAWCDSAHAFFGGETLTVDDVMERVRALPSMRVEITGGEPLLQRGSRALALRLLEDGYSVLAETSGERDIDLMPPGVMRIMDLKAPGSGEVESNRWENLDRLRQGDELKIVIADRRDFDWAVAILQEHRLERRVPILMSPVHGLLEPAALARWILDSGLDVRLSLQLHKLLWGDVLGV